ncbi:hypothetical protein RF55_24044 [Lasius niger]|uniref:Uncharacterized protein n=1 Tax=Lasius niger TaxID=67767 RepID=A0A0J7JVI0_LASNI|nr:hypothetical protein RF55_24044 [Lasius niger]
MDPVLGRKRSRRAQRIDDPLHPLPELQRHAAGNQGRDIKGLGHMFQRMVDIDHGRFQYLPLNHLLMRRELVQPQAVDQPAQTHAVDEQAVLTGAASRSQLNSGSSRNKTKNRPVSAAAAKTSKKPTSRQLISASTKGARTIASKKTSAPASAATCSQIICKCRQLRGVKRVRPSAPRVTPALTTATTPDTPKASAPMYKG